MLHNFVAGVSYSEYLCASPGIPDPNHSSAEGVLSQHKQRNGLSWKRPGSRFACVIASEGKSARYAQEPRPRKLE
ncbi:hypothetical protein CEXT_740741 [Caerostris extrusa]|uniref:Uncharacterized protein n=1 Tax=Caerostris extrusa TaxID=172846 RepID=A0AAV4V6C0_CAEEX|nr:hypothetical protein CEXT_740741 [Caerostris extrusa]